MVLSDENEDQIYSKLFDLCTKLNLDSKTIETAWDNFRSINKNFVLEGDTLHWLGCAVFVASHAAITPTLLCTFVKGNCISLTSLLRHSNLSFVQFFYNINKWAEMAQLSDDFLKKITYLKDTFGVTHNTFKEYYVIYSKIFLPPTPQDFDQPKHRNRKYRPVPCNSVKVFEFIWNLFITLKAEDPQYSTELIKSFHLLYACLDLAFRNAYLSERRDILNPQFECLPSDWTTPSFQKPTDSPCLISYLCKSPLALTEAMHVKVYGLKNLMNSVIKKNSNKKVLNMDSVTFMGFLDRDVFEQNFKSISGVYDAHLLNKIDIDERIFLAEYKRQLLEQLFVSHVRVESGENSVTESPRSNSEAVALRGGDTPLTGRKFLGPREADLPPLSTDRTTQKLHSILSNRSPAPSEVLLQLFQSCENNPFERIQSIVKNLGDKFLSAANDVDKNRLELGITLFYKFVENILQNEKTIRKDISSLVEKDLFYQCMFACCLEIVLFSYGSPNKFPWTLSTLEIQAFHFVKVIELIVRCRDQLSRDMIKHLNKIEETVIENLAWRSNSQLWEIIDVSGQGIPKFEDTALPGHLLYNSQNNVDSKKMVNSENIPGFQSPAPSATDRFQSPINQTRQFPGIQAGQSVLQKHTHVMITDKDGNKKLIPIVDNAAVQQNQNGLGTPSGSIPIMPKRTGSLSIIFRKMNRLFHSVVNTIHLLFNIGLGKIIIDVISDTRSTLNNLMFGWVYNLAGVRMEHLCNKLGLIDTELKQKIWTVFEESIRNSDLIKDRHLDQLLMCAIYVICRISNISLKFQDIMKFYREQPQCSSSVYRDVLLTRQSISEDGAIVSEERSDLIHFYNSVYVEIMQKTAVRFRNASESSNLLLSPLPAIKRDLVCPSVQILGNVYVKPLEGPTVNMGNSYNYFFSRSPSKDLKDINKLVNGSGLIRKRLLVEGDTEVPPAKRISNRKLQSLVEERRSQNTD